MQLVNGDLLLVSANGSTLSGAIDRVTQTDKSTHYSHIGMLEKEGKNYWVLHAGTRNGSERVPLDHFLQGEQNDNNHVDVYRLRTAYRKSI
ncbi:YiiX/YebB-like N1pC/P60 family cysteine hydrolase, partial [Enterobacter hormaechei]|nr:YiiX/YebB-like N1pC/P60 family cysteine hydrolase [Enterobacter hormaechei]